MLFGISVQHEAGYICAMLFIIPGFPFITSGIDLAKLDIEIGYRTFDVCADRRSGGNNGCLDHGIASSPAAGRLY